MVAAMISLRRLNCIPSTPRSTSRSWHLGFRLERQLQTTARTRAIWIAPRRSSRIYRTGCPRIPRRPAEDNEVGCGGSEREDPSGEEDRLVPPADDRPT